MGEYQGPRFSVRRVAKELPEIETKEFLELDRKLGDFLEPKGNQGNMSMRVPNGFLIKRAGARMTELAGEDVSLVLETGIEVVAAGAVPSSESMLHYSIYGTDPYANLILHFHDDAMLERFEGPAIGPFPYGSVELAEAAGRIAESEKVFMIRGHGFVIIAKGGDELVERLKKWKR
ncbi:hypothetical protein GF318_01730 [Candidatus Micrarchaeota archaeon]|nr:hypothetical protein [Candidatus Micrarchaeota archaeon]